MIADATPPLMSTITGMSSSTMMIATTPAMRAEASRDAAELGMTEAGGEVVVDQAARLHERVADRRTDEPEAAALEVLAHRLRTRFAGRQVGERREPVLDRRPADEAPQVADGIVELEPRPRVADRRVIFARLRTIPASAMHRSTSSSLNAATTTGSNPANAAR